MSEVLLHRFNVITGLDTGYCIRMTQIMKPDIVISKLYHYFLEILVDSNGFQMPSKFICKDKARIITDSTILLSVLLLL